MPTTTGGQSPSPDRRRRLPSVDAVLRSEEGRALLAAFGRPLVLRAVRDSIEAARTRVAGMPEAGEPAAILDDAARRLERVAGGMAEAINATGVLLHTGLGRAPLPAAAALAALAVSGGYADLEIDRETGGRGRRTARAEAMLAAVTGAEAGLAVNNNAAALLLLLAALAGRKEVLVSRGELIEIGGEFRLPEIMAASGAKLVEVGTTNRTRIADYRKALGPRTGLILKVHPSNYRVTGFTAQATLPELAAVAREAGIPLAHDVGSGLLRRRRPVPGDEPSVGESLSAGADLVCFSGDKLLGGPQAGLVVGRSTLVDRLRRHPIARAVRLDKATIAALEATLRLHAEDRMDEIPLWRLLAVADRTLLARARTLAAALPGASHRRSEAAAGGGSLPGHAITSAAVVVPHPAPGRLARRLRLAAPAVFCRTEEDAIVLELRSVPAQDDARLLDAVRAAIAADAEDQSPPGGGTPEAVVP